VTTLRLGPVDSFPVEEAVHVKVEGHTVVVVRRATEPPQGGAVCVFSDRCPHLGLSLTRGPGGTRYADGVITCPYHNSRFDVTTGANLDWASGVAGFAVPGWSRRLVALGRKPAPLRLVDASVVDGQVEIHV
jgi:nitrite reductase/ring-hydroxylating ferredoxin subunit